MRNVIIYLKKLCSLNTKFFPESSNVGAVKAKFPPPAPQKNKKITANNYQNKTIVSKLISEKGGSRENKNKNNSRASVLY